MRPFLILAIALPATVPLAAQMVSIPLGGPRPERPSPNAGLRGSPAAVRAAVALRGRPAAMAALDESRRPVEVLQFLGLPLGARVLVVEADPGYYSEIIGAAVGPNGKVTALVPSTTTASRHAMIELAGRVPNVAIVAADPRRAAFAASSFDFVLLHPADPGLDGTPSHAGGDPAAFLRTLYVAVRPGGIVGVVDDVGDPDGEARGGAGRDRLDPATLKADFRRAGFLVDAESGLTRRRADDDGAPAAADPDTSTDRFILRFIKPE